MAIPVNLDLTILQGDTFSFPVKWETEPIVYKAITAITQAAPVVITAPSHGVPNGWRVAVTVVSGMTDINAEHTPPATSDYQLATVLTGDTISLNKVNSADYGAYTSGGYVQYYTPVDPSGYSAAMTIRDSIGGTELFTLSTDLSTITLDSSIMAFVLFIAPADTTSFTWATGVYDLVVTAPDGTVSTLLYGDVEVIDGVTVTT